MDTNIALASLPSGMAVPMGAEDGGGVHNAPPGCAWKRAQRSMSESPFSLQVSFTTVECRATTSRDIAELPLLTLGSSFQGAKNVIIGQKATQAIFLAII